MTYPKPTGWNGGPDGSIIRQGMCGHLGYNPATESGEKFAQQQVEEGSYERRNHSDWLGGGGEVYD